LICTRHHRGRVSPRDCGKALFSYNPFPTIEFAMAMNRAFEALQGRLSHLLESTPARDIERNAKAALGGALSRLDLVTREEFDLQGRLLQRAQEQLAALTERVARLEAAAQVAASPAALTAASDSAASSAAGAARRD
jgi:BMFP domain-containing protein YqiC